MPMLQLLGFSSLLALASAACVLPPAPASLPWASVPLTPVPTTDGKILFFCANGEYIVGNYEAGGPLVGDTTGGYMCDPAVGKFLSDNGQETTLTTITCAQYPVDGGACGFSTKGVIYIGQDKQVIKCPAGKVFEEATLGELTSLNCDGGETHATLPNGSNILVQNGFSLPEVKCVAPKATTTTATTTTTVKPDSPVSAAYLWTVYTYYNYGVGVHAFCADQNCVNVIMSNGIGYDKVNGKVVMGRAVTESAIASVRASCPTGSANLRNLGFTKSGQAYLHNLNGSGLKQGWVSIAYGACGATKGIKKYKSRYTPDIMYDENLEWNTWYQGMVQDGGKIQYYMWA